ncbi:MAG: PD-(D/E)XK nuclease family protein [Gemmatimonadales bacterium]|jgi:RecB family exonuclease
MWAMPLRIVRSATSSRLWDACLERWLGALGDHAGPDPHAARLWLAHRTQRDAALAAAEGAGLTGWFDPPIHFLSELRHLFDIRARPIGLLTGRLLVARLARRQGEASGLPSPAGERGPARSHMLDGLFGELLAEGVTPGELEAALSGLAADGFTQERNRWLTGTYRAYRESLAAENLYDARQIHALVAERIEAGGLSEALRGARALHVYGVTSLGRRERLFRALAEQPDVDVTIYLIQEPEPADWQLLTDDVEELDGARPPVPQVRPAPDALREAAHVARCVKQRIVADGCPPERIAVVARSGRDDTRRIHRALVEAGVPSSARLRTVLAEVPALRALLELFRGEAAGWDYRSLRTVGTTPYFGLGLDPRPLDVIAGERRIRGLDAWEEALSELAAALAADPEARHVRRLRGRGVFADRVVAAAEAVGEFRERTTELRDPRPEAEWIDFTRTLTGGEAFGFRRRLCRSVGERYDVVRLDQRGVRVLDGLLAEWRGLVGEGPPLGAGEWRDRLRRLLAANELALSTPRQRGVQVLEAHEAALTPFRHAFLVHANDGEFPRTPRGSGILSEEERRQLRRAGLPVEDRSTALRRERALWRAVTAGPGVTVSYRTATAAGVPLLPSLMVPEHDPASALPRTAVHEGTAAPAVSRSGQLRRDVLELARLRRGDDRRELGVADPAAVRQAVLAAFAEELRAGALDDVAGIEERLGLEPAPLLGRDRPVSERAHAWGGRLRDPVVRAVLAERYGPEHVWSASQLEQYARRPFDFLLARVLRIEGLEEAEEETTPLASGSVIHAVLEELHGRLIESDASSFAGGADLLEAVCRDVFAEAERAAALWLGLPVLWRLRRRRLREDLAAFVAWDFDRLTKAGIRPIGVELTFGYGDADPVVVRGRDVAGRPAELRLGGRIDRVDRLGGSAGVRVVDYKRKSVPATAGYDDGTTLQPALYMHAWKTLRGEAPEEGLFLSVLQPGRGSRSGLKADRVEDVLRFALAIPRRVRAGLFEPAQARSAGDPSPWQPGREVTRTDHSITAGTRFDNPAEDADG